LIFHGGDAGARTRDLRLKRALLYRLSYISKRPVFFTYFCNISGKYRLFLKGSRIIYKNISLSNFFSFFPIFPVAIAHKKDIFSTKITLVKKLGMTIGKKRSSPFHQYTSAILIFLLFVSQTIQVSFFDKAKADANDYRDIVSIIVDRDTYAAERSKITRYAEDIQ
jgi:hypothetical protein